MKEQPRIIISGGGTGGHIFPAISIANAIREARPAAEILFVGASGKMEMERVPAAGYKIIGIPARGLKRPLYSLSNIGVVLDYLKCRFKAGKIIKEFRPDLVVGVGGYASAAIVSVAGKRRIPVLLQEQNSYAGIVNTRNGSVAKRICVAYPNMERFFSKEKIVLTGNPIRSSITPCTEQMRREGMEFYKLNPDMQTIFVVGGSLGCRTLNNCVKRAIEEGRPDKERYQIIWQCGKIYKEEADNFNKLHSNARVYCSDFIQRMDLAYAAADIVISRAGAGTISELCVAGKCTIFVPSPNVAEDHQTHNAMALVKENAALMIKDAEAVDKLFSAAEKLLKESGRREELERNIKLLGRADAAAEIAKESFKLIDQIGEERI